MTASFRFGLLAPLVFAVSGAALHAQFRFGNAGGDGRWGNVANWSGPGGFPSGAGVVAEMATGAPFTTVLDRNAMVGALRNQAGSGRVWMITNEEGFTLTLDNSGGANSWGNRAAEIRTKSSGGIVCAANLKLRGTDLDVGSLGSNKVAAQIVLSGSITAEGDSTITFRNNRRGAVLSGEIGTGGTGTITLVNRSNADSGEDDPNQVVVAGKLGSKVAGLVQCEGLGQGMLITAANPDFRGRVSVLANSLTVENGATLGDLNTVYVANEARLILQGMRALGTGANVEIDPLGSLVLNFVGTRSIDALSLDGGLTFASPGSTWGAPGSGATFVSAQFSGMGLLHVAPVGSVTVAAISKERAKTP